ncbi:hypothetical protein ACFX11_046668 [Malus domestica]
MEIPVSLRPHVYEAWARALHSNLEEAICHSNLEEAHPPQQRQGLEAHNPSSGCQLIPDSLLDSANSSPTHCSTQPPTHSSRLTHYDSWLQ